MSDSTPKIDRFCVRCRSQISQKRVAGGSCFCSDECRRQDRIERRRARAHKFCRLCTESFRAKRQPSVANRHLPSKLRPVRRAHTCLGKLCRT